MRRPPCTTELSAPVLPTTDRIPPACADLDSHSPRMQRANPGRLFAATNRDRRRRRHPTSSSGLPHSPCGTCPLRSCSRCPRSSSALRAHRRHRSRQPGADPTAKSLGLVAPRRNTANTMAVEPTTGGAGTSTRAAASFVSRSSSRRHCRPGAVRDRPPPRVPPRRLRTLPPR